MEENGDSSQVQTMVSIVNLCYFLIQMCIILVPNYIDHSIFWICAVWHNYRFNLRTCPIPIMKLPCFLLVGHMAIIKFCQAFLFSHYVNLDIAFKFNVFYSYKCLVDSSHDLIIMQWIKHLNTCMKYLTSNYDG